MRVTIQKWGNSLALRIPKYLAEETGLIPGTPVDISSAEEALIIKPFPRAEIDLERLLARISDQNIHDEQDYGNRPGKEAW